LPLVGGEEITKALKFQFWCFNLARSAALRPSNPKAGLLRAAAREPAAQGSQLLRRSEILRDMLKLWHGKTVDHWDTYLQTKGYRMIHHYPGEHHAVRWNEPSLGRNSFRSSPHCFLDLCL